ncbi:SDR family NAD(P)-dependent oxidoreductase [soil metagenome]
MTGASSGIGLELAKSFARDGFDLVIAAEDDAINSVAKDLEALGAGVEAVQIDLARDGGVDELYERISALGRPLDAVALNAGRGAGGAFVDGRDETELSEELEIVDLNVRSVVHLAKYVTRDMVARGHGRILFTSSIASTLPGAYHAVYNASKSFVQSFALSLRNELKDTGVTVTSLMPGPVETNFFRRAKMLDTKVGAGEKDAPDEVARMGYEAMMAGRERVVAASFASKLQGRGSRLMPDSLKVQMHRKMAEPGSARR